MKEEQRPLNWWIITGILIVISNSVYRGIGTGGPGPTGVPGPPNQIFFLYLTVFQMGHN
jgi:hypothetical protein